MNPVLLVVLSVVLVCSLLTVPIWRILLKMSRARLGTTVRSLCIQFESDLQPNASRPYVLSLSDRVPCSCLVDTVITVGLFNEK